MMWSIDTVEGSRSPFYIEETDPETGKLYDNPKMGRAGKGKSLPRVAELIDVPITRIEKPVQSQEDIDRIEYVKFETCAVCRSGDNQGQVYGCVTWGFKASAGKVTLMPRGFQQMPSDEFLAACAAWNEWIARYEKKPHKKVPELENPEDYD